MVRFGSIVSEKHDERVETSEPPLGVIDDVVSDHSLKFVGAQAGNHSPISYQEASGAPVEVRSPLGLAVGPITIVFLNFSKMVGTGIFSTPSSILSGTDSVGLSLIYWFIGLLTSASMFSVYLEFASYFPNRSGSEAVYLEQAYPRPRYLFPLAFAVQTVMLSFSSGNAVVCAQYLFAAGDHSDYTDWEAKGLAIGIYSIAVLLVWCNTKIAYWASNGIGAIKLITLVFIAITGLVVLGGHTRVEDPGSNFRNAFEGEATVYGCTNALIKIIFSYAGYENAFNVVAETNNPIKKIKRSGGLTLLLVTVLYMLVNIAYFAAISKEDMISGKQIAAGLLFTNVFGAHRAVRALNVLIALSAFGNLVAVLLGSSRLMRECGRQGILPFPRFWVTTWPFGTPSGPYLVKWVMTIILIVGPPAGDAFNFTADLGVYPSNAFNLAMVVGIWLVRRQHMRLGLPKPEFEAWTIALVFSALVQVYLLAMPWYPPSTGANGGDVSFWYGTYIVCGLAILVLCGVYYALQVIWLPKLGGYRVRFAVENVGDGAQTHRLVKVPLPELEEWDRKHDATGAALDEMEPVEVEKSTVVPKH